jgi:hypothetical protein
MTPQDRALIMVYESVKHRLPFGFEQYAEAIKDFDIVPLTQDGRVIGGVLAKGNEIHVGYGVKPRSSIRPHIKATLKAMIDQYGYVVTAVMADNKSGLRFCERLGFVKLGEENGTIKLRCDRSNYS